MSYEGKQNPNNNAGSLKRTGPPIRGRRRFTKCTMKKEPSKALRLIHSHSINFVFGFAHTARLRTGSLLLILGVLLPQRLVCQGSASDARGAVRADRVESRRRSEQTQVRVRDGRRASKLGAKLICVFPFLIFLVFVDEGVVEDSVTTFDQVALFSFLLLFFLYAADDFGASPAL